MAWGIFGEAVAQRGFRRGQHHQHIQHNADDVSPRFELFLLDEGQQKIEVKEETRK